MGGRRDTAEGPGRNPRTGGLIVRRCPGVVVWSIALVSAGVPAGCRLPDAGRAIYAERVPVYNTRTQRGGTWFEPLPPGVPVPAVIFAAEAELVRRGYTIEERDATVDEGFVVARSSDSRLNQRVVVDSQLLPEGADLAVRMSPNRDPQAARAIAERVRQRVGM